MVQLQVKNQTDNTTHFLDLGEVSIKADFSVLEIQDITKRKSENTQTFTLPFTETNNDFFSHFYDLSAGGDSPTDSYYSFNPNRKTQASILVDSIEVIEGYLQLLSVNATNETYEVIVYGLVANIVNQLSDSKLNDLDLSEFNHVLNETNVMDSWDGAITYTSGQTGDDILYPIIDYGFEYDIDSLQSDTTANKKNPITCENLKPAIKVRTLLKKILSSVGYGNIDSGFTLSDFFDNQYMTLGTSKENINNQAEDSFRVGKQNNTVINYQTTSLVPFTRQTDSLNEEFYTSTNLDANGYYTAAADGYYRFRIGLKYSIANVGTNRYSSYALIYNIGANDYIIKNGQILVETNNFITFDTDLIYLEGGQTLKIKFNFGGNVGYSSGSFTIHALSTDLSKQSSFELIEAPASNIGTTIDLSTGNNILPQITQIEFLKSILSRYNIVLVPDKFVADRIEIEPIQDYFDSGNTRLDWTDKIDNSKPITIKPTYEYQKDKITFKDLEGDDYITQMYEKANGYPYNYFQVNIDSDFKQKGNNLEIPSVFSSFTTDVIDGTKFMLARLYQIENAEIERIETKPKIFYYSGKKDITEWYLWESLGSASPTTLTEFPFCSSFSMAGDSIQDTDFDIRYLSGKGIGEEIYTTKVPKENTFNKCWQQYLDNIFNKEARILTANLKLNSVDIANLEYNDRIFIKDSYYRVNKVSNYAFGKDVSTRVELVKILDYFNTLSIAGCDLEVDTQNLYGIVSFKNPNTGSTVPATKVCCESNGFTWYEATSLCVNNKRARINTKPPTAKRNRINSETSLGRSAKSTKIKGDVTEFANSENATSGQVASWNTTDGIVEWQNPSIESGAIQISGNTRYWYITPQDFNFSNDSVRGNYSSNSGFSVKTWQFYSAAGRFTFIFFVPQGYRVVACEVKGNSNLQWTAGISSWSNASGVGVGSGFVNTNATGFNWTANTTGTYYTLTVFGTSSSNELYGGRLELEEV